MFLAGHIENLRTHNLQQQSNTVLHHLLLIVYIFYISNKMELFISATILDCLMKEKKHSKRQDVIVTITRLEGVDCYKIGQALFLSFCDLKTEVYILIETLQLMNCFCVLGSRVSFKNSHAGFMWMPHKGTSYAHLFFCWHLIYK